MPNDPFKDFNDGKASGINWGNSVAGALGATAKAREEDEKNRKVLEEQREEFNKSASGQTNEEVNRKGGSGLENFVAFVGFVFGFAVLPDMVHVPKENALIVGIVTAIAAKLLVKVIVYALKLVTSLIFISIVIGVIFLLVNAFFTKIGF